MKTERIVAIWNNISEKRYYFCLLFCFQKCMKKYFDVQFFLRSSNTITLLSQTLLRFFNRTFCWD